MKGVLLTALVGVALDDGEGSGIFVVLHDEPASRFLLAFVLTFKVMKMRESVPSECLFVFGINLTGFLEFRR